MRKSYVIPTNFMETGYVLNGAVAIRNAIEAGVLALVGFLICKMLPLQSGIDALPTYIFIIAPFAMAGIVGVQGDPLSTFVIGFFKWRKRRNPYFYSGHNEAYTLEAAEKLMDAPQFRDMLADVVDGIRAKMATEEVQYVEGKTFEFATDPEQAALKQAQDDLLAKQKEELSATLLEMDRRSAEDAKKNNPFQAPKTSSAVDAHQIAEMMVLDELDWEEDASDGKKKA